MSTLVIAEHDNTSLKGATLNTVAAAQAIGGDIDILGGSVVENDNGSNDLQGLIFMDAVNLTLDEGSSLLSGSTSGTGGFFEIRVTNALLAGGSLIAAEATEDSGIGGAIGGRVGGCEPGCSKDYHNPVAISRE